MHDEMTSRFGGIHAATVLPLKEDFSIDDDQLASHIEDVISVDGIHGLLVNGHAGENFLLSRDEKRRVVEIVRDVVPRNRVIVCGVNAESSLEAAADGRSAEEAGADALLVFPPNSWALFQDEETALIHHRHIAAACGLPLFIYQAPVTAGRMGYTNSVLEKLTALPRIIGIKEGSWEVAAYEEHRRLVKRYRPDIIVLASGDEHLLTSFLVGTEGSQVSLAAIVPELVVALWNAAVNQDWEKARKLHDQIYPLATAIYRTSPSSRATARLKTCLQVLGRLRSDRVRPPFHSTPPDEIRLLQEALDIAL